MVLVVAATAYVIGLQLALFVALLTWAFGRMRYILAADRDRRLEAFRDNWSRRFHRGLFATDRGAETALSSRTKVLYWQ